MIEIVISGDKLISNIPNIDILNNYVVNKMELILDNDIKVSDTFKTELYEIVLKSYILSRLNDLELKENKAYMLSVKIGTVMYRYIVANYKIDNMIKGLDINQTLLA